MITAPKIPPLPHTWHGPGWWDQATSHRPPTTPSAGCRGGGGQGRVVAGGCWEESPEQAVTTLFLETLFLLAARYGQGGRAWRLHKKKSWAPWELSARA